MKTFLWTTLFRFVVAIAALIVTGFGNLVPDGFVVNDYYYFTKLLPNQVKNEVQFQGWNKCMQEQSQQISDQTVVVVNESDVLSSETQQFDLTALQVDILGLKEQMDLQFNALFSQLSSEHYQLALICQSSGISEVVGSPVVDLNVQKRAELQAQIEQLQAEMEGL